MTDKLRRLTADLESFLSNNKHIDENNSDNTNDDDDDVCSVQRRNKFNQEDNFYVEEDM